MSFIMVCFSQNIVSSVRESLINNLLLPHISPFESKQVFSHNNINSTVVLILAVSGGCDSVALFHSVIALTNSYANGQECTRFIHFEKEELSNVSMSSKSFFRIPCEIHVAHFNHKQRGANSDADERLVRRLCSEAGVPIHCYSWSELENDKSSNGVSASTFSQDAARKWRRRQMTALLASLVAESDNCSTDDKPLRWGAILTAHHRDDSEETILLKLLRGAHLTNLSGMENRSDAFQMNNDKQSIGYFSKPLLGVRKGDIVHYLKSNGFEWREDESNSENKYRRNKVRNQLMPLLCEIAGGEDALHVSRTYANLALLLYSSTSTRLTSSEKTVKP